MKTRRRLTNSSTVLRALRHPPCAFWVGESDHSERVARVYPIALVGRNSRNSRGRQRSQAVILVFCVKAEEERMALRLIAISGIHGGGRFVQVGKKRCRFPPDLVQAETCTEAARTRFTRAAA